MGSIAQWIASNSQLPVPAVLPEVRFVPPGDLATLRLGLLGPHDSSAGQLPLALVTGEVVAFYDAEGPTIYLGSDWTGGTPAELSILVHEMVHHASAERQGQDRVLDDEPLAFLLQDVWLRENGETLEGAFGIDPFALTMMTQWTY